MRRIYTAEYLASLGWKGFWKVNSTWSWQDKRPSDAALRFAAELANKHPELLEFEDLDYYRIRRIWLLESDTGERSNYFLQRRMNPAELAESQTRMEAAGWEVIRNA